MTNCRQERLCKSHILRLPLVIGHRLLSNILHVPGPIRSGSPLQAAFNSLRGCGEFNSCFPYKILWLSLECASLLSLLALYGRWNISTRTKAAASCRTPKSEVGCAVEFVAIKTATNSTNFYEKRSLPITLGLKRSH